MNEEIMEIIAWKEERNSENNEMTKKILCNEIMKK